MAISRRGLVLSMGVIALSSTAAAILSGVIYGMSGQAAEASPQESIDGIWQLVAREYVDDSFNDLNWREVRTDYLNRTYTDKPEAYTAIHEMLAQLDDPYTRFMDPQAFENWQLDNSGELSGVGILLYQQETTDNIVIVEPIAQSPAEQAGILSGDIITAVDGQSLEGMTLDDAVSLIRGLVDSTVQLTISRADTSLTFDIARAPVEINPVHYSVDALPQDDTASVGYIYLSHFGAKSSTEVRTAIQSLEAQNVTGYILDLRSNPGGSILECADIVGMWLHEGLIVSTVDRHQVIEEMTAQGEALTDKPLVILVNGESASASELLSGAMQDYNRATVVGTQTFGKGLVQSIGSFPDGSGFAVTIAKYLTPLGRDINEVGIEPDVVVSLTAEQRNAMKLNSGMPDSSEDPQYARAISVLADALQENK